MTNQPNILFFITDQFNADCLGFLGHPFIKTPNLDRLAAQGVYANRMFTCSAVCGPSRTSFATGMYLRGHGVFGNNGPINHPYPSLPEVLKSAGYVTALAGKSHFPLQLENHFQHKWDMHLYRQKLQEKGLNYKEYDDRTTKEFQALKSSIPEDLQNEVWTANHAVDFIESRVGKSDPFFLWCSFDRPHCPHTPPASFDDLYDIDSIPVDWGEYQNFEESLLQNRPMIEDFWKIGSVRHDVSIFKKAVCRYLALITLIDREIGRILDKLEASGLAQNTIIVFTSDHGDFAGKYGQLGKNLPAYDPLLRIPFIYFDPTRTADAGRGVERLLQSVDVMPTLLERLGIPIPPTVQGKTFLQVIDGHPKGGRDFVFAETSMEKTIRSKDWKLTFFVRHPNRGQLFRMGATPDEVNNLWNDPNYAHIREELLRELCAWMVACEQPSSAGFQWEEYISTPWYDFLAKQPRHSCGETDYREFRKAI